MNKIFLSMLFPEEAIIFVNYEAWASLLTLCQKYIFVRFDGIVDVNNKLCDNNLIIC